MEVPKKKFPLDAKDYKLYEEVGEGVSASVYRALCVPLNEIVAIKVLDLEKCNNDLDGIRREVQTMSLINHPNLLRAYCSFTTGHSLWVVMPYMAGGSCLHIMKSSFAEGFEEPVIATLLREVLKALIYLHAHGHIHRDVKAGNILVDYNGSIKLADFGVSACMFDAGDRQRSRNTFVGTPCWMAPEVMQQLHGYDFKADIWSFGITALELAHGHAPFSKYPPMKVLLMTLQNAPPGLDYERDKKFSKSFKEMVAACLVKDPKKRPSSEKLLKHPFFKHAKTADYLERTILDGLSPLGDRFRMLKAKEADLIVQNKDLYGDKEHLSQQEYIRGISAWNFNLEDLKNQAALIDLDEISNVEDPKTTEQQNGVNGVTLPPEKLSPEIDINNNNNNNHSDAKTGDEIPILENSLASFPIEPLQALEGCFDVCEDDVATVSLTGQDENPLSPVKLPLKTKDQETETRENVVVKKSLQRITITGSKKFMSGSLLPDNVLSPNKLVANGERDHLQPRFRVERNYSGPLQHLHKNNMMEDVPGAVVQLKGRFKVTEADFTPKATGGMPSPPTSTLPVASLLPSLQSILQHNTSQREEILGLIKSMEQASGSSGNQTEHVESGNGDISQTPPTLRERELHSQVIQLQQSIGSLVEQLQRQKMRNAQLEKKVSELVKKNSIKEV
ncbi:serine/threonine-protein kinase BLUS1 [Lactuca sativa]|uniref:serine/threonine-protein kinase BLUS1 n=1 Tax=Lactuca sativa TaxID=4236 RepID=UPI0022AF893C|nr:serine/threonine-protein kinase BLUS1 [Lactuca sativa]XP_052624511.1 serine/threonine-protein kinase BLUS1 [Lactuca sativa]XP_052624512.1 serine/threonine-protein kinase BLUS1 [Lactuca sativa]